MWPFKRKKSDEQPRLSDAACTQCGSLNTTIVTHHGTDKTNYIRTWRGQRYVTCRCLDCGQDFYSHLPEAEIEDLVNSDDRVIDDEEALREAENELKRQIDEENDRTLR